MNRMKVLLLLAVLAITTVGVIATPADALEDGGYDCEGSGDACKIPITREDGSKITITGARGVVT